MCHSAPLRNLFVEVVAALLRKAVALGLRLRGREIAYHPHFVVAIFRGGGGVRCLGPLPLRMEVKGGEKIISTKCIKRDCLQEGVA